MHARSVPDVADAAYHWRWLTRLRWIAIAAGAGLISIANHVQWLPERSVYRLAALLGLLALLNLAYWRIGRRYAPVLTAPHLLGQIGIDVVLFTAGLNLSGGIENPLYVALVFHGIIASMILPRVWAVAVLLWIAFCYLGLVAGEFSGLLPHQTVAFTPHSHADAQAVHPALTVPFLIARSVSFTFLLSASGVLAMMMAGRLREREKAARAERHRLMVVLDTASVDLFVYDENQRLVWANRPNFRAFGTSTSGPFPDTFRREDLVDAFARSRPQQRTSLRVRDGQATVIRSSFLPSSEAPTERLMFIVSEDITSEHAAEMKARHAERLTSLGLLASVVVHELGNPVAAIQMRVSRMMMRIEKARQDAASPSLPHKPAGPAVVPPNLESDLRQIGDQASRALRIIGGLRTFGSRGHVRWSECSVDALVADLLEAARAAHPSITFEVRTTMGVLRTSADPDQIREVLGNVLSNSVRAVGAAGHIEVVSGVIDAGIEIRIRDNGPGMSAEMLERCCEPFHSGAGGMGLGLAVARTLIEAHGGNISARNIADGGLEVRILLPLVGRGGD